MTTTQPHQPSTILLVEDDALIAMATAHTITRFGYEVVTAHTGEQAVEFATGNQEISLILMDINLGGGIDGTEAATQILAQRHLPIVFLTSHTEEEYVNRVKQITRYGYVIKHSGDFVLKSSIEMAFELFKEQERARHSEAFLNATGSMARVGGWELDAATQTVSWTEATYRIHELPLDYQPPLAEAINFFHPDDRERLTSAIQRALEYGEPYDLELRFITAKGKHLWVRTRCEPIIRDGTVVTLHGTFQDIDERKQAEHTIQEQHEEIQVQNEELRATNEELRATNEELLETLERLKESEEILQIAMDQSQAGIAIADAPDGTLRYVNDAGLLIRGGNRTEIVEGIGVEQYVASWRILHFDGTPYRPEEVPLARAVLYGETCREEFIIRRDNHEDRIVLAHAAPIYDARGKVTAGIVVFLDITERKRFEAEHQKEKKFLEQIARTIPVGIAKVDNMGKIVYANHRAEEVLELREREIEERTYDDPRWNIVHSDGTPYPPEKLPFAIIRKTGKTIHNIEHAIQFPDGRRILLSINAAPLYDKHGAFDGMVAAIEDITERRNVQEELQRIEWLLTKSVTPPDSDESPYQPPYGDVTKLNTCRVILDAVGPTTLRHIAENSIDLLETSVAVYEQNGDYAFGMFSSGWCQFFDLASRRLCGDVDNREALSCGQWLCHENCWNDSAKAAIESGEPTDIACVGGIRLYAMPIYAGDEVVGAINIGYGDPPQDETRLRELAERFHVDVADIRAHANAYESRPSYIIELAKKQLHTAATLIGEIVERKHAEQALKHSQKMLARTEQIVHVGSWEWDIASDTVIWSKELYRIFKLDFDVPPPAWAEHSKLYHPEDMTRLWKAVEKATSSGVPYELELRARCLDGTSKICLAQGCAETDENGNIVRLYGSLQDITARKHAEQMLRMYQLITDIVDDAMSFVDTQYLYKAVNKAYSQFSALSREEIIGKTPADIVGQETFEYAIKPHLDRCFAGETVHYQLWAESPTKGKRYMEMHYYPFFAEDGTVLGAVSQGHDMTEFKIMEDQLREVNAIKDKFFSIIAHDLKNPVLTFQSGTSLLNVHLQALDDAFAQKVAAELHTQSQQLFQLLDNLLTWAQLQRGEMAFTPGNIALCFQVHYIIKQVKAEAARKQIAVTCGIEEETGVYADYNMLQYILRNLIVNAIKFTEEGGQITITSRETGEWIEVAVSDTGVGMPADKRRRLFRPGERKISSKGTAGERGTGLGLILCKEFVDRHGGEIWVESDLGQGTTVAFTVARAVPPNDE